MDFKVHTARRGKRPSRNRAMQEAAKIAGRIRTEIYPDTGTDERHREYSQVKYQAFLNGGEDK